MIRKDLFKFPFMLLWRKEIDLNAETGEESIIK